MNDFVIMFTGTSNISMAFICDYLISECTGRSIFSQNRSCFPGDKPRTKLGAKPEANLGTKPGAKPVTYKRGLEVAVG